MGKFEDMDAGGAPIGHRSIADGVRDTALIDAQLSFALATALSTRDISIADLAEAIGEDEGDLANVIGGHMPMTAAQMVQIHRVLGTHPSSWLDALVDTGEAGCLRFDDAGKVALRILALPRMAQEIVLATALAARGEEAR